MKKYRNKYRIPSARMQTWDYGGNGTYFITICTTNRVYFFGDIVETPTLGVSTTTGGKNEKWKPRTIGVIINQYKRIVTINARKINANFGWQSRFHDHIIRDDRSFQRIQKYIADNAMNWGKDKFNG